MVGIGSGELFRTQSASQFTLVESAIMVAVQLVKQCRCGLLRFREIDRAIVIRVKHSNPVRMAGLRQDRRYAGKQDTGGKCENYGAARYHGGHLSRFRFAIRNSAGESEFPRPSGRTLSDVESSLSELGYRSSRGLAFTEQTSEPPARSAPPCLSSIRAQPRSAHQLRRDFAPTFLLPKLNTLPRKPEPSRKIPAA